MRTEAAGVGTGLNACKLQIHIQDKDLGVRKIPEIEILCEAMTNRCLSVASVAVC